MNFKRLMIVALVIVLLMIVAVNAQDTPPDYPEQPQNNSYWIRTNFPTVDIVGVGYADGQYLYRITSDLPYENVSVWGSYPVVNDRWERGRYGQLRPFIININVGEQYLWVDSWYAKLAYYGVTSPFISARGTDTPISVSPEPMADVVYEFPLNPDIVYNVVTPEPAYVIDYSLCFDFVILMEGVNPYEIYQDGMLFASGTISQGEDFEWHAPMSNVVRRYSFVVNGFEYSSRWC